MINPRNDPKYKAVGLALSEILHPLMDVAEGKAEYRDMFVEYVRENVKYVRAAAARGHVRAQETSRFTDFVESIAQFVEDNDGASLALPPID